MNARHFGILRASGAFLFAVALANPVHAALLAYEPYAYADGADLSLQAGGSGWATSWGDATGDTAVAGSLDYVDAMGNTLITSGNLGHYQGGLTSATGATNQTTQSFRDLPALRGADGTTTWLSFVGLRLGEKTGTPPTWQRAANFSLFEGTTERLAIGEGTNRAEDTWSLVPAGGAGNTRASAVPFEQQSLIVLRIDHLAGNDNAYLFVNPILGVEPNIATADTNSLGAFSFSFNRVRPFAGNMQTGHLPAIVAFDEVRIGDTYGDVTPFIPEPSTWALVVLAAAGGLIWKRRRVRG
jgi:hypothetical protein